MGDVTEKGITVCAGQVCQCCTLFVHVDFFLLWMQLDTKFNIQLKCETTKGEIFHILIGLEFVFN